MSICARALLAVSALASLTLFTAPDAHAQRRFRFAYDQPKTTGYGVAGDIFASKLSDASKGTFAVDQYPGAQLGQEPQVLQLLKSGDLDFAITSTANTATVSPQAGVFSLHFLFRDEAHLTKSLADPGVVKAVRDLTEAHFAQCMNYLRATGLRVCLLINFATPKIQIKRIAL